MARKLKIGVIFGGRSGEHAVSLASARSILNALDREKYDLVPIGITHGGRWLLTGDPLRALTDGIETTGGTPVSLRADPAGAGMLIPLADSTTLPVAASAGDGARSFDGALDVVFPVLHGTYGEDGTVQGLLELADVAYVGAGVLGSALGMDKIAQKEICRYHGLPTVDFILITAAQWARERERLLHELQTRFSYPLFVKPSNLGSSVGISKVHNAAEFEAAIDLAVGYDRRVIVEAGAGNVREIEVSVLGNDDPVASVPGEILPSGEFYDYNAKYVSGHSGLIIPADLPPETVATVRRIAVEAFRILDCAGMARVDFFVERGTNKVLLNEINTIPGFTQISMYPKLWEASGVSYRQLVDRLIELARERHQEKRKLVRDFQPGK